MLEAILTINSDPIAHVRVKNVETHPDGTADYVVEFAVERGMAVGLHRRTVYAFPRKELNALALLRLALETLDKKELSLERNFNPDKAPVPTTMARRLGRTLSEVQAKLGKLHRN